MDAKPESVMGQVRELLNEVSCLLMTATTLGPAPGLPPPPEALEARQKLEERVGELSEVAQVGLIR